LGWRLTPSAEGGTIATTDKSSTAGEMLLKGPSHRYLWFILLQEAAITFPQKNDDNVSSADVY